MLLSGVGPRFWALVRLCRWASMRGRAASAGAPRSEAMRRRVRTKGGRPCTIFAVKRLAKCDYERVAADSLLVLK